MSRQSTIPRTNNSHLKAGDKQKLRKNSENQEVLRFNTFETRRESASKMAPQIGSAEIVEKTEFLAVMEFQSSVLSIKKKEREVD